MIWTVIKADALYGACMFLVYLGVSYAITRWRMRRAPPMSVLASPVGSVTVHHRMIDDLIARNEDAPLPLSVIPNHMGINLCSVRSIHWTEQPDGQLVSLTIQFIPANPPKHDKLPTGVLRRPRAS
ncbi:MAG TPA: hypothetical protein VMU47_10030 [Caldimonas sp.]|nr:hypothetical protein [Caldimonas sp.]